MRNKKVCHVILPDDCLMAPPSESTPEVTPNQAFSNFLSFCFRSEKTEPSHLKSP